MDDIRPFPIQADSSYGHLGAGRASVVPWWLAEIAYKQYAKLYGKQQTLERLAERGGFGRAELVALLQADKETFELVCLCPADGVYPMCPKHRQGSPR